jgi:phosphate transport system protein
MAEEVLTQHISHQFDTELRTLRSQMLSMGGLVEEQLANALQALKANDEMLAKQVYNNDYKVNALEVTIDEECTRILARRQPTAGDLRLVLAVIKTITDLERIGDEAERIARMSLQVQGGIQARYYLSVHHLGELARQILHDALDSIARLDTEAALAVIRETHRIDGESESVNRQVLTYMMEDPRMIPLGLTLMWSARALERVIAHSRNVCEYLIYFLKGKDIRHISLQKVEEEARQPHY